MVRILCKTKNKDKFKYIFAKNGVTPFGIKTMIGKTELYCIEIEKIKNSQASILKQEMLSLGGEVAVHKEVISYKANNYHNCIIIANENQLKKLIKKLKLQPYGLNDIATEIAKTVALYNKKNNYIKINRTGTKIKKTNLVMGILNITPDSFYDGGKYKTSYDALVHTEKMVKEGIDILDVGGESSRPNAKPISAYEECKRIIPVIKEIRKKFKIPISVDTYKDYVARTALDAGADIINDITGLKSNKMANLVSKRDVPIILMHMQGTPITMQKRPIYDDVVLTIMKFFEKRIEKARFYGINDENIILDPGIGFGKTSVHNLEIIKRVNEFKSLGFPILMGLSRKSFVGDILNTNIENRLEGTIAAIVYMATAGVSIFRVHDVLQTRRALKMVEAISKS